MHRVLEAEQIELLYEAAERCMKCKEMICKQPAYVEVVFCPRFNPVEPKTGTTNLSRKRTKGMD